MPVHPPPSLRSQALLLEELRLCNLFECGMSIAAVERLRELSEAELAAAATAEGVVALVHAAAELSAPQLVRFCLQMISDNFDTLRASGALDSLRTPLTAEVLLLHSTAPLQEALKLRRVDAMALLLARTDALPPATPASLVATLDCEGRTALETALRLDDLESSATLLEAGAAVDAMAGGGDETLLHLVAACDSERSAVELAASRQKVELLLRYGASVNAQNGRGESPLDVALFGPAPPLVQERTPPHVPHCRYPRYATLISIFVACTRLIPRAAPARARRRVVDGNRGGRLCAARGGAGRPPRSPARGTRRW